MPRLTNFSFINFHWLWNSRGRSSIKTFCVTFSFSSRFLAISGRKYIEQSARERRNRKYHTCDRSCRFVRQVSYSAHSGSLSWKKSRQTQRKTEGKFYQKTQGNVLS